MAARQGGAVEKPEKRRRLRGKRGAHSRDFLPKEPQLSASQQPVRPPNDACASRLALGNACSQPAPTVAALIGWGCGRSAALRSARRRHCRKPLPLVAGLVAGWPRLSLPGRFPEAGALLEVGGRGAGLGPDQPSLPPPSSRLL